MPIEPLHIILDNHYTSKPSFRASSLAVSIASSLDTWKKLPKTSQIIARKSMHSST